MYIPPQFAWTDHAAIAAFMARHSFATVVAQGADGFEAQHIPLLVEGEGERTVLAGHVARGNPLWRAERVLAIFTGPHAYVSASWYGEPDMVPTWNYQAVHVHGTLSAVSDPAEVRALFARLGAATEGDAAAVWQRRLAPAAFERLAGGIVWFRIAVTRIEAKAKLSQHHTPERRRKAIAALRAGGGENGLAVAAAMAATLPPAGDG